MTYDLPKLLRGHADNVEGDGWLSAARRMRQAADELEEARRRIDRLLEEREASQETAK